MLLLLLGCQPGPGPLFDTADPSTGLYALPLGEPERYYQTVNVDHDPIVQPDTLLGSVTCADYDGRAFPWCYDEHDGTDFLLTDGWEVMDSGSTPVLAARDGEVVAVEDGHYDRCHADLQAGGVTCDGHEKIPNKVVIEHSDGQRSRYLHLQKGSVEVELGHAVACGDLLGRVGSSGNSSFPHLHFELHGADGARLDPYQGSNHGIESLWIDQGANTELPGTRCL